jgi:hypothetical protein
MRDNNWKDNSSKSKEKAKEKRVLSWLLKDNNKPFKE